MKIRVKLLAGYLGVAALCAVVGILGIVQLSTLQKNLGDFADMILPKIEALDTISYNFAVVQAGTRSLSNERGIDDDVFYKAQIDSIATARAAYGKAIKDFEAMPMKPDEQKLWQAVKDGITPAKAYNDQVSALFDKARALKAQVVAEAAQSGAAARTAQAAASGQSAKTQRDAIFAEVFGLVSGAQTQSMDVILVAIEKLRNWDRQYYGDEMTKAALAQASIALVAVIVITVLAIVFAVAIGFILGNSISRGIRTGVAGVARIAAGDLSQKLASKSKDEIGELSNSVNTCIDNVAALVSDADMLAKAAVEGKLATRADASKHQGDYRKVVEGVNKTLDAVIGPVSVAAGYMERIAKGDLPPKITEAYQGDFNKIKDSVNVCIESINALVEDASFLVQAAVEGRLATRADGGRHQGDYRKIVDGVNRTLDLVITPINETVAVLKRLAEGDLTLRMAGDYKGDFDILKTALNDSLESFNDTLRQVNIAVDQVAEGALQVSQASQSLSQGATEQAASLEEITSSVTEIAGQTKLNTENANQVNSLAITARKNAEQGNEQMGKLVIAMGDINKSAEDIKKITKAIDDIAFQINLLALNANVEAARAGKYGKGFAVVAEEVRNLAVRSANSVKDTTRMVEETIANISRGNTLCDLTAKQLAEIVGGAGQVATLAEDVAAAGREQTQGLEQITQGLNQIDQVTQANTAASEESASASEELSSQSQQVKGMLSRFRIKESEAVMNNAEVMAMLRAEMAKQGGAKHGALPAATTAAPGQKAAVTMRKAKPTGITPADVISLDDDNFGKF